jgi:CheY-like chemotaxis protein
METPAMSTILLIDDDRVALMTSSLALKSSGHTVMSLSNAEQALLTLLKDRNQFDVIVSDLNLPGLSGLVFLERLRSAQIMVPFIVLTGFGAKEDAIRALRLGANDFLEKPIPLDELLESLNVVLRRRNMVGPFARIPPDSEAHSIRRWARSVTSILASKRDVRTVPAWSQLIYISPGTLRNWCRTADISPRRSLIFGRLLRAAYLGETANYRPEDALDVVDKRTLIGLLERAGFNNSCTFPNNLQRYIESQALVRDPRALDEIRQCLPLAMG